MIVHINTPQPLFPAYVSWIRLHVPTSGVARGNCAAFSHDMVAAFPELEVRVGRLRDGFRGSTHWWCRREKDGIIVDPTLHQWPEVDPTQAIYMPWIGALPTGKCPNCGETCYNDRYLCSQECEISYERYIMSDNGRFV